MLVLLNNLAPQYCLLFAVVRSNRLIHPQCFSGHVLPTTRQQDEQLDSPLGELVQFILTKEFLSS